MASLIELIILVGLIELKINRGKINADIKIKDNTPPFPAFLNLSIFWPITLSSSLSSLYVLNIAS